MEQKATVLLIGSKEQELTALGAALGGRYDLLEAKDLKQGVSLLKKRRVQAAALVLALSEGEEPGGYGELLPQGVPVLAVLPAGCPVQTEERLLEEGCADAVRKPCSHRLLRQRLEDLLRLAAAHDQARALEDAVSRLDLLIRQSDNAVLQWDMCRDRLEFSENWARQSGYPAVTDGPEALLRRGEYVHADDVNGLYGLLRRVKGGFSGEEMEVRILDKERHYRWYRLRLSALVDAEGVTYRAVGTLTDIDSDKRSYLALQEQAKKDPLTGLLNKGATQSAIRTWLEDHPTVESALLMIDLDDFKGINDRFGHLFGDTVLTRTAQTIRKMFRGDDVVGRIGGDEFMVLMKDVHSRKLLEQRCLRLMESLEGLFGDELEGRTVTCSVGVARAPQHAHSFQELFQRADQALYHSKMSGKHCYTLYSPDMEAVSHQVSTPIDSNDQPGLANGGLVAAAFQLLAQSQDVEQSIGQVLAMMGQRTNVSRVYIFENNEDNTCCSNTFEWCNEGITPEKDNLQNICYATDLPGWEELYDEQGILFCPDIAHLKEGARALLEPQGVKSLLHCAIREKGVFRGYIGLDECTEHRVWTKEQIEILTSMSQVAATFLLNKRAGDRAAARIRELESQIREG